MSPLPFRSDAVLRALAAHPGGLTTTQVMALAYPDPGRADVRRACYAILRRHEREGRARRAGRDASGAVIWHLKAPAAATTRPREARLVALLERKLAALTRMEEGMSELEQVEREIEAAASRDQVAGSVGA